LLLLLQTTKSQIIAVIK